MDKYGLTEKEKEMNIQKYNHALFRNMMFFMDIVWEINMETLTMAVLEDKDEPYQSGTTAPYERVYKNFLNNKVREKDRELFGNFMSLEKLRGLTREENFDIYVLTERKTWNRHRFVITPAFDSDKNLYCVYVCARNMQEEERRIQKEYQNQQQLMDALTSNSPFYFSFDVSGDGMIHEDFVTTTGYHPIQMAAGMELPVPFELFAKKWYEIYEPQFEKKPEEDIFTIDYLKKAFERSEHITDIVVKQKSLEGNGESSYVQIFIVLTERPADHHIWAYVIWRDISSFRRTVIENNLELENHNRELKEAYESVNKTSAAKTDFLAQMSHNFRIPMNTIIGMTAIAGKHLFDHDRVRKCLNRITDSSRYMLVLLNEILDMSDIESEKLILEENTFNITKTLENLMVLCRNMAKENEHAFTITPHGIAHDRVIGDSFRVQQVFMNLATNAIRYTPDGGDIYVSVTEKLTENKNKACFEFTFKDNGIGMDRDYMAHLFEPFLRAKDHRVERIQGSGLGLPITKALVEMMDGTINIESELDVGTTVTLTMYFKLPDNEEVPYADSDEPVFVTKEEFFGK